MTGETDLKKLLREMRPELNEGQYVFCTADAKDVPIDFEPVGLFHEREGVTLILAKEQADVLGFPCSFLCAWITLNIHSSLEAVGLTAAVSQALALAGVSCNMVAGYYHDHLFVPLRDARRALDILYDLSRPDGDS